jgi:hypothetical protein
MTVNLESVDDQPLGRFDGTLYVPKTHKKDPVHSQEKTEDTKNKLFVIEEVVTIYRSTKEK